METTEFLSPTGIQWNGKVGTVEYGNGDKGMVVLFYTHALLNPAKSREKGSPQFDNKHFVRIHQPGERWNIIDREVKQSDVDRWPQHWQNYISQRQQQPEGCPIEILYPDNPAKCQLLRSHGVSTVELLSELSGNAIENIGMGAQAMVNEAIKYLDRANKGVKTAQFRHEIEQKDREIKVLTEQVHVLMAEIKAVRENQANLSPEMLQAALVGMMGRPVMPQPVSGMRAPNFDPQTALINANSPQTQETERRKRKVAVPVAKKRARTRISA